MKLNRRKQRGHTLMECSLVLLGSIALLLGAADFGQVMFFHQGLAARAQIAAQYAAVNEFNATQIKNVAVYGVPTAASNAVISGLTTSMVVPSLTGANTADAMVEVRIENFPFRFFSPWIAGLYTARPIVVRSPHEPSLP